jgi:biotin-(acetyl-CoA carboxylase) ligase
MQIFQTESFSTSCTAATDALPINHFHFGSVDSTQNKCQEIIQTYYREGTEMPSADPSAIWAVTASEQTQGRGTNQRSWTSIPGNMFLTVAVPIDLLQLKIRKILPLKLGTILASCVHDFLQSRTKNAANTTQAAEAVISLKWPNDVLLNDCKVAGVLIESFSTVSNINNHYVYYFIIGIGVNVAHTPTMFGDGRNARPATCLADYSCVNTGDRDSEEDDTALSLAMTITNHIHQWLSHIQLIQKNSEGEEEEQNRIIHSWERWAQPWMGKKTYIRDQTTNNVIIPLGIQLDGQLKVQYVSNNNSNYHQIGLLPMTDYLL